MTEIDYEARVAKGIALLNMRVPGWVEKVDLELLDISSGTYCVTAQISGVNNWLEGSDMLELTTGDTGTYVAYGFNAEDKYHNETGDALPDNYHFRQGFDVLNWIWKREIAARQSAS